LAQNFVVKPGNFYTFRITASQVTTTDKFDQGPILKNEFLCKLQQQLGQFSFVLGIEKVVGSKPRGDE
jgi:hypothetical protein